MSEKTYKYVIVGGGLAGASAVEGIREIDKENSVLLIGAEGHAPYHRPPLSKKLWSGQKKVEDIYVYDQDFYQTNNVDLVLGSKAVDLDASQKVVVDSNGGIYRYDKLLLATGGVPRVLDIPGGKMDGVIYYRYLDNYLKLRSDSLEGKTAVLIGGGYIGSELAAALTINNVKVKVIFPEHYLVQRLFPENLGRAIQDDYIRRGVEILSEDLPSSIEQRNGRYITHTSKGKAVESDIVIAGLGLQPEIELAQMANLSIENGIVVNEYLQSSNPDIYAAGDNANFPYQALGQRSRVEHWDNSLNQGKQAGRNLAGASEQYTYMPYFFSDLFDFGYEAVGELDSRMQIFADWQKENDTGVLYYMKDNKVRGVMLFNVWDKVDAARDIIQKAEQVTPESLRGAIK